MNGVDDATRTAILAARASARGSISAWRGSVAFRQLEARFAGCPPDDPAPAMAHAAELLGEDGWAQELLDPLLGTLAAEPLFEPPLRANRDAMRIGAVLFECPTVSIAACRTSAAAMRRLPAPMTITFAGRLAVTRYVRAGGATLRRWQTRPAGPDFCAGSAPPCVEAPARVLADGDVVAIDGHREAQLLADAASDVVTLVATVRTGAAPLMREHAIADGRLLRVASGDDRASRAEMLLAFLRLARRADASDRFEEATHDPAFHLRWAAMREWLALDARAALPRLAAMAASDPHAEIRDAAAHMLALVQSRVEATCLA